MILWERLREGFQLVREKTRRRHHTCNVVYKMNIETEKGEVRLSTSSDPSDLEIHEDIRVSSRT